MTDSAFFYGTLMSGFNARALAHRSASSKSSGAAGSIGALFDLGIYPAATPATDDRMLG